MRVAVYTAGKVSKAKGLSAAAAVVEGLPEGRVEVSTTHRPNHPTPNSVAFEALALGIGTALAKGADELEVFSPSKNAVRAVDGTGGASYETQRDAILAAWVILWREERARMTFAHRPAGEMGDVVEVAAQAVKRGLPDSEPQTALALDV